MGQERARRFTSPDYNYVFCCTSGNFARWGRTLEEDPWYSPIGPELADVEVSTVCTRGCPHCSKDNQSCGSNMSLETFRRSSDS